MYIVVSQERKTVPQINHGSKPSLAGLLQLLFLYHGAVYELLPYSAFVGLCPFLEVEAPVPMAFKEGLSSSPFITRMRENSVGE